MYLNKVFIAGNLTKTPELVALQNGTKVVNFGVATNKTWKNNNGEKQEKVTFHNCKAFGKTAEVIAQYFTKGKPIFIEGEIDNQSYEVDGVKKYKSEILVNSFQFMNDGFKAEKQKEEETGYSDDYSTPMSEDEINPEDIPF